MELHIAIKNLVKYKNKDFINEPQFINALVDFNAFENYPSLKNITRILLNDGYGRKVMAQGGWTMQAQSMVTDIVRDYSFDASLVEYVLKSIAFGIGSINDVTQPAAGKSSANASAQSSGSSAPSSINRSKLTLTRDQLYKMDEEDRFKYKEEAEAYIESIIEKKGDWANELKAKIKISPFFDTSDCSFQIQFEIDGKIRRSDCITFVCVAYNDKGKTLVSEEAYNDEKLSYQVIETGWFKVDEIKNVGNVSRLVIYWKD